ncbi:MAG: triose-phosphate isomerase [Candidatus Izemoplasmatales bacterium]
MRKPIIAANWKMFKTRDEALFFVLKVSEDMPDNELVDTVIFPQAPMLRCLITRQGEELKIGAQNLYYEDEGAYTGEISGPLLKSYNVDYVLIGHSERRQHFSETDEDVNKKIKAAIRNDLLPIVCVGENLSDREKGNTNKLLEKQVNMAFKDISAIDMKNIVIAYEPIWAIGTGKTATAKQADEACGFIRDIIKNLYGDVVAGDIRIQYGGSVKPENIDELIAQENIDGALIGGASLDPEKFIKMANAPLKLINKNI